MKVTRFLLALPLLCTAGWAAPADELVLPEKVFPQLESILTAAVQRSPRMINRALDLEIAENGRISARSGLLPNVGGYYSYYEARDDRADLAGRQDVTKIAYSLTLTQPLFHWGERRNNARVGEIQQKIAQGNYQEGYRLLVQELRTAYLRLIVQKAVVKRTRFYVEVTQSELKQQEERLLQKVISGAEIAVARLAAEQAQLALERTEFDFQTAKQSFARLSGSAVLSDDAIPNEIPETRYAPVPVDTLLAGFLAQKDPVNNEASAMRSQLEMEVLNYKNQKTRLRPKFNLVLGNSQDEQSYSLNVAQKYQVNSLFGGVSASWTLFDGFAASAAQRTSLARRRQIENDYRQLTERLAQDAQTQAKQINFAARNMSIYDRFLVSGKGALETAQSEFQRGVKSESDVSKARLALYDAEVNAYNSRLDFMIRTGDFLGTLMEDPALANVAAAK